MQTIFLVFGVRFQNGANGAKEGAKECIFVDLGESYPNSNEYLLAKMGVDTAENEPLEVWGKVQ